MSSQNDSIKSKHKFPFIRVYDLDGKKIAKGKIEKITDSVIFFEKKNNPIHFNNIGFIKTKRSGGNNFAVGAAIGGGVFLYPALDEGGYFIYGIAGGSIIRAAIGGIVAVTKKSIKYEINFDENNFLDFKKSIYINSIIYYYD